VYTTTVSKTVDAPIEFVFQTISNIENYSKAVSHITNIEFLSETKTGVGTRFRETRLMRGKEASTELEVKEYVENDRVRMVSDSHGTIWDSLFTVRSVGGQTELTLQMDADSYKLVSKIINLFIRGMVRKGVESDMNAVKEYCEKQS
jgi:carbon monoxide dehydrogenase subunit G